MKSPVICLLWLVSMTLSEFRFSYRGQEKIGHPELDGTETIREFMGKLKQCLMLADSDSFNDNTNVRFKYHGKYIEEIILQQVGTVIDPMAESMSILSIPIDEAEIVSIDVEIITSYVFHSY